MNLEFDEPIAERTIEGAGGREVVVKLGPPRAEGPMWLCPYRIEGLDAPYAMFGAGADSIQALVAALANIGAYLNAHAELGLNNGLDFLGFLDARRLPRVP